jgi:hypothetical protein
VNREVDFYAKPGPMTDLSSVPPDALVGLPDEPAEIMKVVRGCVIDPGTLTQIHKMELPQGRDDERQIRPVASVIDKIIQLDRSPLIQARPPDRRFFGTCRNYATLACALLRHTGTPARVRAGFAGYFVPNTWMDHWIVEYRRDDRWVRVDPELDDDWLSKRTPGMTSEKVAAAMYLSGSETWQRCRSGELDPDRCNMGGDNWGIGEVRGSVLLDLAAINQDEMLPWDDWGRMVAAYRSETGAEYDELLDRVSAEVTAGDFDAVRELYENHGDLRVPAALAGRL